MLAARASTLALDVAAAPWQRVDAMAFHFIISAMLTAQLTRTCPKCAARQVTRATDVGAEVRCVRCGGAIPPKEKR